MEVEAADTGVVVVRVVSREGTLTNILVQLRRLEVVEA